MRANYFVATTAFHNCIDLRMQSTRWQQLERNSTLEVFYSEYQSTKKFVRWIEKLIKILSGQRCATDLSQINWIRACVPTKLVVTVVK